MIEAIDHQSKSAPSRHGAGAKKRAQPVFERLSLFIGRLFCGLAIFVISIFFAVVVVIVIIIIVVAVGSSDELALQFLLA